MGATLYTSPPPMPPDRASPAAPSSGPPSSSAASAPASAAVAGQGSHREHRREGPASVRLAVVTASDTRGEAEDASGRYLREAAAAAGHALVGYRVVKDDPEAIRAALAAAVSAGAEAVLVNGGTGIAARDRTYEAVAGLLEKRLDGFGELFRLLSYAEIGSAAMLSRAVAGVWRGRAVFSVPGSTSAVRLAWERLIAPRALAPRARAPQGRRVKGRRRLRPALRLGAARVAALAPLLDRFARDFDAGARLGFDPVELPRRYRDPADQEVAGLLAAALAYGRADLFKPQLERVLAAMGRRRRASARTSPGRPTRRASPASATGSTSRPTWPRWWPPSGTCGGSTARLGARFAGPAARGGRLGRAPPRRPGALRRASCARRRRRAPSSPGGAARGLRHLLPDAALAGACQALEPLPALDGARPRRGRPGRLAGACRARCYVPLDTHVARVARRLGLTRRPDATWRTAEELTASLRLLDPADPVRFDFALCHLGMSGRCPPRLTPVHCQACSLAGCCATGLRVTRGSATGPAPRPVAGRSG